MASSNLDKRDNWLLCQYYKRTLLYIIVNCGPILYLLTLKFPKILDTVYLEAKPGSFLGQWLPSSLLCST